MSQENLTFLSNLLNISLDELKKIEIPEKSVIVTSIRDVHLSTLEEDPPVTRKWDEYRYEIQRVEYICQDCLSSFSSAEQHRQHVLSSHTDIKIIKTEECEFKTQDCNPTVCNKDQTRKLATENPHDINRHVHHHGHQSEDKKLIYCSTEKELECLFCRKIFTNKKTLMLHLETHKTGDNYHCDICLYTTKFFWTFKNHMNQHISPGLLICYECGDSFVNKSLIKKHLKSHHKSKFRNSNRYRRSKSSKRLTEECPFCKKKIFGKRNLTLHKKSYKKGNHFHCNVCLYKTKYTRNLERHTNKHLNYELYICYHCGRSHKFKASLEKHLFYEHGLQIQLIDNLQYPENRVGKNPRDLLGQKKLSNADSLKFVDAKHKKVTYQCDVCLYTTSAKYNLDRHIRTHETNKRYFCFHCGASYKIKASLVKHLNFHRDSKSKSINHHQHRINHIKQNCTCLVCQKKFPDVKSLCRHKGTHKKGNNYHCNVCLYKIPTLHNFDRHMKKHINDKLYTCYHCGKSFKKKKLLKGHLNSHRDPNSQFINHHNAKSAINKKLVCLFCQKKFSDIISLEQHKETHNKGDNYHCNACFYKTKDTRDYESHINKHMNDGLHTCYHCEESFRIKASLEKHFNFCHNPNFWAINRPNLRNS
ncbi:zinc finger protein 260-like [Microplitis mediator]|uniref:zinc finger protein 260-like n=1 Tax=Microplitis mediator TaxID=375433 RepID=UPI00255553B2|nr:zinc finger protein 260-like [Microplitis mediator]